MSRRKNRSLEREEPKKEAYDLVLIVCEGEKTEKFYFRSLIKFEKLSSVNIKIISGTGSDPVSVIKTALKEVEDQKEYLPFNKVYCVVDRDEHKNFSNAVNMIKDKNLELIISYPSFEYWYLCHFKYSRAPITRSGTRSSGDNCVATLNAEWKKVFGNEYEKNTETLYEILHDKLEIALSNAAKSLKAAESEEESNPSTKVHILVDYLRKLKI